MATGPRLVDTISAAVLPMGVRTSIVRASHNHGALVAAAARDEQSLQSVASELGERVLAVQCDVRRLGDL